MTTTHAPRLFRRILLPLTILSVSLTGCSSTPQPDKSPSPASAPAQSQPSEAGSPQAANGFCDGISAQMEGLNFFPLALSSESGGTASLQEVEQLHAIAPATVEESIAALQKTMENGVQDPDAFNRGEFIEAKIQVEDWILANC